MALSILKYPFSKKKVYTAEYKGLTIKELINMTPLEIDLDGKTYTDKADIAGRNLLMSFLKNQSKVKGVFFGKHCFDSNESKIDPGRVDYQKLAVAYTCQAMRQTEGHGFSDAVDIGRVKGYLELVYRGPAWSLIGADLYGLVFPEVVVGKNNNSFQRYLDNNPIEWAQKLSDTITSEAWLNEKMSRLVNGTFTLHTKQLNVLLYMVDRLDHSLTEYTVQKMRKVFTDLNLDFTNRRWSHLDPGLLVEDVQRTIDQVRTYRIEHPSDADPNMPRVPTCVITVYGEPVEKWLQSTANNYQFYAPGKLRNETTETQGRCSVM